jgi:hypothetical protein
MRLTLSGLRLKGSSSQRHFACMRQHARQLPVSMMPSSLGGFCCKYGPHRMDDRLRLQYGAVACARPASRSKGYHSGRSCGEGRISCAGLVEAVAARRPEQYRLSDPRVSAGQERAGEWCTSEACDSVPSGVWLARDAQLFSSHSTASQSNAHDLAILQRPATGVRTSSCRLRCCGGQWKLAAARPLTPTNFNLDGRQDVLHKASFTTSTRR